VRRIKRFAARALLTSAVACGGPAEDGCADRADCPGGQACVFLSAAASRGVCVEPTSQEPPPGSLADSSLSHLQQLDVLFVIDDGPAIAGRAEQVGAAAAAFVAAVQTTRPRVELRVAVTSTAIEHPLCAAPVDIGALRTMSCRARLAAFTAEIDGATVDARAACTAGCPFEQLTLRPTATTRDTEVRVRPWLESDPWGTGNLPDGVSLTDAVRCAAPQGVAGCRFGGPVEAMRRALERMQTEGDPAYGFLRDTADTLVVMIAAGNDCSLRPGSEEIFIDNPVFWGELTPPDLTPGVCWRAGVMCEGPGPVYPGCEARDLGLDGQPTTQSFSALRSANEAVAALAQVAALKEMYDVSVFVGAHVIGGVPTDGSPPVFADGDDPAFLREHGIGPGCAGDEMRAPPPVRTLASAAYDESWQEVPRSSSICAADWTASMTALGAAFAATVPPNCYSRCAVDEEPSTPGLQPECEVMRTSLVDPESTTLPPCELTGDGLQVPAGAPACFRIRTDEALDPLCVENGSNVEFELVTAAADPPGIQYLGGCRQSANKAKDCPNL